MISSCDVGSLPLRIEESTIKEGARRSQSLLSFLKISEEDTSKIFEEEIVSAFLDKLRAGLDFPSYPQFRDMNEMFFELIRGIEKGNGGYVALRTPSAKHGSAIAEVDVLKRNASVIRELSGVERVRVKACVTGPYTLASFFNGKTPKLFKDLGRSVAEIVSGSLFNSKHGEVAILCVDEPVLGFLNDPLLDYGSEGRGALRRAWETIFHVTASRGVETSMHLHDTSDDIFWDVEHLDVVESHVGDPLYDLEATRRRLEETDKRLRASVSVTLFDSLIDAHLRREGFGGDVQQRVGEVWTDIRLGRVDPILFLEDTDLLNRRLTKVVERFGSERIPYVGPECGLSSFPTYETAMECLRRVSEVVRTYRGNP